jgi:hypothetical protein
MMLLCQHVHLHPTPAAAAAAAAACELKSSAGTMVLNLPPLLLQQLLQPLAAAGAAVLPAVLLLPGPYVLPGGTAQLAVAYL